MARLNLLEETRFEKLPVSVFENEDIAAKSGTSNFRHH